VTRLPPMLLLLSLLLALVGSAAPALAGPSTIIWIPSVDVQPFATMNLGIDNYFRANGEPEAPPSRNASRDANTLDIGLTFGVLPFKKLQMEVGADYLVTANDPNDQHPWSGNIKLATPEEALFPDAPAFAIGLYNARPVKDIETSDAPNVTSGQNIVYGLVAKTVPPLGPLPSLGRFAVGYYRGSRRALVNVDGQPATRGLLLSWDRVLRELSDQLWFGMDYQGGHNVAGAFNVGFSWAFARDVTLLFGYDLYTESRIAGTNTLTLQLDIRVPD